MTGETSKTMNVWPGLIATGCVVAAMVGASLWVWDQAPDSLPVHFGLDGTPDRWGSKLEALLAIPALTGVLGALMAGLPQLDPRRENLARSASFYYAAWFGVLALLAAIHAGAIATAMGSAIDMGQLIAIAAGALIILIGNFMGKSRPNWFAGIRTPWTLSSDYAWQRTHRIAGPLFMLTGAATIAAALVLSQQTAIVILVAGLLITSLLSVVLSYVFWKSDPERME